MEAFQLRGVGVVVIVIVVMSPVVVVLFMGLFPSLERGQTIALEQTHAQ